MRKVGPKIKELEKKAIDKNRYHASSININESPNERYPVNWRFR